MPSWQDIQSSYSPSFINNCSFSPLCVLWQFAQEFVLFWKLPCVLCVPLLPKLSTSPTLMPGVGFVEVGATPDLLQMLPPKHAYKISIKIADKPYLTLLILKTSLISSLFLFFIMCLKRYITFIFQASPPLNKGILIEYGYPLIYSICYLTKHLFDQ